MQRLMLSLSLILIGSAAASAVQKSVVCHMKGLEGTISFAVPNKIGDLPAVDFDYPATVTRFSMRTGNLLLVAMDQDEKDRPRIFISAQLNKQNRTYEGQYMADFGGNQLQLDNGPVSCKLE
ncbi:MULTISPECIES: hypothetical protein [Legionella]|uniref:C-type lysozyme inhibitor domain-containing protein n=1 Tax=Legionella resiliens TaxID=2905958 RepID=A0ABS8WYP0_9GAMM|nr:MULTISPECIES: hypothetical protein [unclassified Legionella]MCE0721718.1 hypothetical protein [Legionella sp. 9fVS26]MCE3530872.1 hypothetical protein [Legionella sp. 8cVS16]QLZ70435.1 hypothetical protein FOLKNPGA_03249 [Legionella sp. PC1000]